MAINSIAGVSNVTLWNMARKADPTFASHTSEGTADLFSERGFEAVTRNGLSLVNEWFNISLRIAFQMLNVANAKNPLSDIGLVEVYDTPNGGYVQRMAMNAVKPVTPAYRGLNDGDSPDPFVVRKPELSERFFAQNFDFQNLITHQDFQVKTIFISEYGMGQILAGIMAGLQASYIKQEYYNTLECLNAGMNSDTHPLKDSQVVRLSSWTDAQPTTAELTEFIKIGKNIARHMKSVASTSEYNSASFDDIANPEDYVMLVRPEIMTEIETLNALNAPGNSSIPFEVHEVENFGGMKPVLPVEGSDPAELQPIYDNLGVAVAYVDASVTVNGPAKLVNGKWVVNITSGSTTADTNDTYVDSEIEWVDPNAEVLAVIAQRGVIFENAQNGYIVEPIRNPRGLYDNYWASRPGTAIVFDYFRGLIVIAKPTA